MSTTLAAILGGARGGVALVGILVVTILYCTRCRARNASRTSNTASSDPSVQGNFSFQNYVTCQHQLPMLFKGTNDDQGLPPNGYVLFSTEATQGPKQEKKTSLEKIGAFGGDADQAKIIATLAKYLWMKDNSEFLISVLAALGLLIGAKVINVQVPFLFKLAVDWLSAATGNAGGLAEFTTANSTALALFAIPRAVLIG